MGSLGDRRLSPPSEARTPERLTANFQTEAWATGSPAGPYLRRPTAVTGWLEEIARSRLRALEDASAWPLGER